MTEKAGGIFPFEADEHYRSGKNATEGKCDPATPELIPLSVVWAGAEDCWVFEEDWVSEDSSGAED